MYEFLRKVPLFADLPKEDVQRLCEMVEEVRVPAGEMLFHEGDVGDRAYVVRKGQLEILKSSSGRDVLLAVREAGEVIGEVALLEEAPRMASGRARTELTLIAITKEQLEELVSSSISAARSMFFTVISRLRSTTAMLQQSEKMAQLGTLSAGVAHELNNPAAAVKRGADQLRTAVQALADAEGLPENTRDAVADIIEDVKMRAGKPSDLDALERSDLEEQLEQWLEERDVDDAWELAPMLAGIEYDTERLEKLEAAVSGDALPAVVKHLGAVHGVYNLLAEISHGAGRISDIVKALKSYSYLDQAPVQTIDVHEGLDDTLLILRSKLKSGIKVIRDYDDSVPRIQAYGSELNQVWTNLIDNAADAVGETGEITLRTRHAGDWIEVMVQDNGPGIPDEIQSRIFDAFFTTKPPGKGTGLGLDISYNIVVHKHRGAIDLFSEPGNTRFKVKLPVNFEDTEATAPPPSFHPPDGKLREILERQKTIAVVGLSGKEDLPGHTVPKYLQEAGYRIVPINPHLETVLGEQAYPDLASFPDPVDTVLVFRKSEAVPEIAEAAIAKGAGALWAQEGIFHQQAGDKAQAAGLDVVMDVCMRSTHRRLMKSGGEGQ